MNTGLAASDIALLVATGLGTLLCLAALVDAARSPGRAFTAIGSRKFRWVTGLLFGPVLCGPLAIPLPLVYFINLRPRLRRAHLLPATSEDEFADLPASSPGWREGDVWALEVSKDEWLALRVIAIAPSGRPIVRCERTLPSDHSLITEDRLERLPPEFAIGPLSVYEHPGGSLVLISRLNRQSRSKRLVEPPHCLEWSAVIAAVNGRC
jgi:hypothetical protein